jgi:hypothetical protein
VAPISEAYCPIAHAVHDVIGWGPKKPTAHWQSLLLIQPVPSPLVHADVVAPAGQAVHAAGPVAGLNVPTAQLAHVSVGEEIVPVAPALQVQSFKALEAVFAVLDRAGHEIHAAALVSRYCPMTHAVHVSEPFETTPE